LQERWARFWAVDLHVHTPGSEDAAAADFGTPDDIVSVARARGLDCIAVTDHNTASWCQKVAEAAVGKELVVLPGVEISTREGHLLGIWEEGTPISVIEDLLIRVGIERADFGRLDVTTDSGLAQCAREISLAGGLAIPAHIDKERGLLSLPVRNHANATLVDPAFAALEYVKLETVESVRQRIGGRELPALVQGSDAYDAELSRHAASGIGIRRTLVKAARPDLVGIRHALADPDLRISVSADVLERGHPHITSLEVSTGFLGGVDLAFSPDMNSLLGGTGSGKSLAVEALRFALDQQADAQTFPQIDDEVQSRLRAALGVGCEVSVVVEIPGGRYRIQRRFTTVPESPKVFQALDGAWVEVGKSVRDIISVAAFSQGEVLEYARQPVGRMGLIDAEVDLSGLFATVSTVKAALEVNADQLLALRRREKTLSDVSSGEAELRERVQQLSDLFDGEMVRQQSQWTNEQASVAALLQQISTDKEPDETPLQAPAADSKSANASRFREIKTALEVFTKTKAEAGVLYRKGLEAFRTVLTRVSGEIDEDFAEFTKQFDEALLAKGGTSVALLRGELQTAQTKLGKADQASKEFADEVKPALERAVLTRDGLLTDLNNARQAIRTVRRDRVSALNKKTAGHVKLDIPTAGDPAAYRAELDLLKIGSRVREPVLDAIAKGIHPFQLVRIILSGDSTNGDDLPTGVAAPDIARLIANVHERDLWEVLMRLQIVDRPDVLRMSFRKPEGGAYVGIEELSHGQKCTAILVVLLADGENPVLVDQPEDALHAPWIEDYLVERLRELRGSRQYIFATRSPGLVVSADSEQIITMRASASSGEVEASGSLERHDLNDLALHHLEGGRPPFERRARKLSAAISKPVAK
jgi:PHP family Zn ribbon phosphoesterase